MLITPVHPDGTLPISRSDPYQSRLPVRPRNDPTLAIEDEFHATIGRIREVVMLIERFVYKGS